MELKDGEPQDPPPPERKAQPEYIIRIVFAKKAEPFQFKIRAMNDLAALGIAIPIVSTLMPRIDGFEIWRLNPEVPVVSCGIAQVLATIGESLNKFIPGGAPFPAFRIIKPSDQEGDIKKLLSQPEGKK